MCVGIDESKAGRRVLVRPANPRPLPLPRESLAHPPDCSSFLLASCTRVSVWSQVVMAASQAFTSDCRVDEVVERIAAMTLSVWGGGGRSGERRTRGGGLVRLSCFAVLV